MSASNDQFPVGLLQGGPLGDAYIAIRDRLKLAFPENGKGPMGPLSFTHQYTPPKMSEKYWAKLTSENLPLIGLGFTGWQPDEGIGRRFRGNAGFIVFLLTKNDASYQMLGDQFSPGLAAMICVATAFLHGWNPVGSDGKKMGLCTARQVNAVDPAAWVGDHIAIAAVEIVVADLTLSDPVMETGLPNLLQLGVTWSSAPDADVDVINVRGNT